MRKLALFLLAFFIGGLLSLSMVLEAQSDYLNPGTYNQSFSGITKVGSWITTANVSASGGNFIYTSDAESYIRFSCICTSFDVIYAKGPTTGNMLIYVDGFLVSTSNTQSGTESYGHLVSITGLEARYHTVTVKRGSLFPVPPYGEVLAFDGVIITNAVTVEPTAAVVNVEVTLEVVFPEVTPEPVAWRDEYDLYDTEGNSRAVAFEYKFTAGEVAIGVFLFGILFMMIVQFARDSFRGGS